MQRKIEKDYRIPTIDEISHQNDHESLSECPSRDPHWVAEFCRDRILRNETQQRHDNDFTRSFAPARKRAHHRPATSGFHVSISLSLFARSAIVIRPIVCVWQRAAAAAAAATLCEAYWRRLPIQAVESLCCAGRQPRRIARQAPITDNQFRRRHLRGARERL